MSYRIYIGDPEDMENLRELYAFSKEQHEELFSIIKNLDVVYCWLFEIQAYETFMNYHVEEIKSLMLEIECLMKLDILRDNVFLTCLLQAGKQAVVKNLQLLCSGDE